MPYSYKQKSMKAGAGKKKGKMVSLSAGLTDSDKEGVLEVRANNAKLIEESMNDAIIVALEKIGLLAEGYAKQLCPVDTGRLRNSITHVIDNGEKAVYIGTNVEYGKNVEFGTSRQKAQPFLRPAASDHSEQYRGIIGGEISTSVSK